jgi:peptide/nickel transport system permease protein
LTPTALLAFLTRRGAKAVLVILAVIVLNFLLIRLAPGDPALVIAGQSGAADEQFVAQLRAQFGLDRPTHEQLWIYVSGVATLACRTASSAPWPR